MPGLLEGVRVLDLTNVLAGPFATYQLAMLGAEVVKIEAPGDGDLARSLGADPGLTAKRMGISFLAVNAGKKSVVLDLKNPRGRDAFLRLAKDANVVVEAFRPGVMQRLGLDHEALKRVNPKIVYCAISGFGQTGPLAKRAAYDQIIQGYSGVMSVTGDAKSAPLRTGHPVADTTGGLTAAMAICAAVVRQQGKGEGAFIDVSMLDSTVATLGWLVSNYLNADVEPAPMGNENFTASPSGTFRTKAGLLNIAANEQKQFEALCDALGRPHLKTDGRFVGRNERKKNRAELKRVLEEALATETAEHWELMLNEEGVPSGRVFSIPQILAHEHAVARSLVKTFKRVPGAECDSSATRPGFHVDGAPLDVATPPPRLGEHTEEVLRSAGLGEEEVRALLSS
ncbi:CaiB/BaiF CoA transferase family protein [Usitatibacter palustris]|uniref:Acetyl-CoA:oxalate CoA-transferase n=1 Tax=Usitatibacter palustris TaxID=2732487 RepID=A0A6M4H1R9_9PROT|nr:CoA transferase [Usitatibacter palustris]QJR13449.1 Acetyl-CoA:oxalate CoA-transferase [Usitatibacter palustris]